MEAKTKEVQSAIKEKLGIKVDPVKTKAKTQAMFRKICESLWTSRGAKFNEVQCLKDLDLNFTGRGYTYYEYGNSWSLEKKDKFLTLGVSLEMDVDLGAVCILWGAKITKKGVPSKRQQKIAWINVEQRWFKQR